VRRATLTKQEINLPRRALELYPIERKWKTKNQKTKFGS
jgi:hypothetical protein